MSNLMEFSILIAILISSLNPDVNFRKRSRCSYQISCQVSRQFSIPISNLNPHIKSRVKSHANSQPPHQLPYQTSNLLSNLNSSMNFHIESHFSYQISCRFSIPIFMANPNSHVKSQLLKFINSFVGLAILAILHLLIRNGINLSRFEIYVLRLFGGYFQIGHLVLKSTLHPRFTDGWDHGLWARINSSGSKIRSKPVFSP